MNKFEDAINSIMISPKSSDIKTASGFEGPEKLLEIWFKSQSSDMDATEIDFDEFLSDCEKPAHHYKSSSHSLDSIHYRYKRKGFRHIDQSAWQNILDIVQCKILSIVKNEFVDAYLLR